MPALLDGALEPGVLQGLACCGALCRVPAIPNGATLPLALACTCPSSLRVGVDRVCSTIGVLCRLLSEGYHFRRSNVGCFWRCKQTQLQDGCRAMQCIVRRHKC